MAVVESTIMFESWIVPFLRFIYKDKHKSSNKQIDKLFQKKIKNEETDEDMYTPVFISEIIERIVYEATGFAFHLVPEYISLKETITLRNNLVHGKKKDAVTRRQAWNAYDSVKASIILLTNIYKNGDNSTSAGGAPAER